MFLHSCVLEQEEEKMSDKQVNIELDLNGAFKQQVWSPSTSISTSSLHTTGVVAVFQAAAAASQGAMVSFHSICYNVKEGGSCLCRKKSSSKAILIDLK